MNNVTDTAVEMAKTTPAVTVAGMTIAGITLNDVVLVATLAYTLAQFILLLPKFRRLYKDWKSVGSN